MRALARAGEEAAERPLRAGVSLVHEAIDALPEAALAVLQDGDPPLLHFVAEAALAPRWMEQARVTYLRDRGFDDRAVHDVVQVVCCFSYMNRLADSLGVAVVGEERLAWATRLFGAEAVARHREWADG